MDEKEVFSSPKGEESDAKIRVSDILNVEASAQQEARMMWKIDLW
jgi:hypothetical protein